MSVLFTDQMPSEYKFRLPSKDLPLAGEPCLGHLSQDGVILPRHPRHGHAKHLEIELVAAQTVESVGQAVAVGVQVLQGGGGHGRAGLAIHGQLTMGRRDQGWKRRFFCCIRQNCFCSGEL